MSMKPMAAVALAAALAACTHITTTGPTHPAGPQSPYVKAELAIDAYKNEPGCRGPSFLAATAAVNDLSGEVAAAASPIDPGATDLRMKHYVAAYDLADTAKSKHCLDEAEAIYRGMLDRYPDMAYAHLHERSNAGLADVRQMRAQGVPGQ
jgi:TolA-binding protein